MFQSPCAKHPFELDSTQLRAFAGIASLAGLPRYAKGPPALAAQMSDQDGQGIGSACRGKYSNCDRDRRELLEPQRSDCERYRSEGQEPGGKTGFALIGIEKSHCQSSSSALSSRADSGVEGDQPGRIATPLGKQTPASSVVWAG